MVTEGVTISAIYLVLRIVASQKADRFKEKVTSRVPWLGGVFRQVDRIACLLQRFGRFVWRQGGNMVRDICTIILVAVGCIVAIVGAQGGDTKSAQELVFRGLAIFCAGLLAHWRVDQTLLDGIINRGYEIVHPEGPPPEEDDDTRRP